MVLLLEMVFHEERTLPYLNHTRFKFLEKKHFKQQYCLGDGPIVQPALLLGFHVFRLSALSWTSTLVLSGAIGVFL